LALAIVDEENNFKWRWLLLCLQRYVISDRTCICVISNKYVDIKNGVAKVWREPIEYHLYYARYFISNFNHKFKDPATKKDLMRKPYEPSKYKFDCAMKEYVC